MKTEKSIVIGLVASILIFTSCKTDRPTLEECISNTNSQAGVSQNVDEKAIKELISNFIEAEGDDEKRKEAAIALGKIGPPAAEAIQDLYPRLYDNIIFIEGSVGDETIKAIAKIAQKKAVPLSYVAINFALQTPDKMDDAIKVVQWGFILDKVGPDAVPCVCEIISSAKDPIISRYYILILDMMKNAVKDKKEMAIETLKIARNHTDQDVRKSAENALASLTSAKQEVKTPEIAQAAKTLEATPTQSVNEDVAFKINKVEITKGPQKFSTLLPGNMSGGRVELKLAEIDRAPEEGNVYVIVTFSVNYSGKDFSFDRDRDLILSDSIAALGCRTSRSKKRVWEPCGSEIRKGAIGIRIYDVPSDRVHTAKIHFLGKEYPIDAYLSKTSGL